MFGISGYQFLLLMVLAFFLIGPERLPQYARTLAGWVRRARGMAEDAKVRFREETGTDFDSVDWQKYDPRQYDPRRIIREALSEEYDAVSTVRESARLESPGKRPASGRGGGGAQGERRTARSASRAGVAGAAGRSQHAADPRAVFGAAGAGTGTGSGQSSAHAGGAQAGGALAAGVAGAAAAAGAAEEPEQLPAPFDVDAT